MIVLRIVFIAQLVLMLPAFAFFVATPANLHTAILLLYLLPVGCVLALYALWQFKTHPDRRRLAMATAATPLLCLALPFGIVSLNGGPVAPALLISAITVLLAAALLVLLGRTDQWRNTRVFANRHFNLVYLMALGLLLALLWLPVLAWLGGRESIPMPTDLAGRDPIIRIASLYFIAIAVPSIGLSVFALFYAPVGLVRNPAGRVIHAGQLLAALLLLVSLAALAFAVFIGMLNPG
jgi:hypothetical protein